ncbi:MAG: hypothetical protein ACRDPS_09620 [Nocardioides sp.]|uniref:hypothetical protein n=1 Tax=Nocardioides sp. TaxID=35761 RepID=UPI003D6ADA4F
MSMTAKTSAENIHDLLVDLAVEAQTWLEAMEYDNTAEPRSLMTAIDDYTDAVRAQGESESVLESLRARTTTMEEIEKLKRRKD